VIFSSECGLYILDYVIGSASKGTPAGGEHGDQFDPIAREMVDKFRG
jgi:hypothetical protein